VTDGSHTDENGDINMRCMCFVHYNEDVNEGSGADWIYYIVSVEGGSTKTVLKRS